MNQFKGRSIKDAVETCLLKTLEHAKEDKLDLGLVNNGLRAAAAIMGSVDGFNKVSRLKDYAAALEVYHRLYDEIERVVDDEKGVLVRTKPDVRLRRPEDQGTYLEGSRSLVEKYVEPFLIRANCC